MLTDNASVVKGQAITADWANNIMQCVRALAPSGPGVSHTPMGTVISKQEQRLAFNGRDETCFHVSLVWNATSSKLCYCVFLDQDNGIMLDGEALKVSTDSGATYLASGWFLTALDATTDPTIYVRLVTDPSGNVNPYAEIVGHGADLQNDTLVPLARVFNATDTAGATHAVFEQLQIGPIVYTKKEEDAPAAPAYYKVLGPMSDGHPIEGGSTALTTSWTNGETDAQSHPMGLWEWYVSRVVYDETSHFLYAFARKRVYDEKGRLYQVTAEERYTVDEATVYPQS